MNTKAFSMEENRQIVVKSAERLHSAAFVVFVVSRADEKLKQWIRILSEDCESQIINGTVLKYMENILLLSVISTCKSE